MIVIPMAADATDIISLILLLGLSVIQSRMQAFCSGSVLFKFFVLICNGFVLVVVIGCIPFV